MNFNTIQDVMILIWMFLSGLAIIRGSLLGLIFACTMIIATLLTKQIKLLEDKK